MRDDPDALIVVILPDGGRSYLSKIYSDAWITRYRFLERPTGTMSVGEVIRRKRETGEVPPLVTVRAHDKVRDAVALLHEHRVSEPQLQMSISSHDPHAVVGGVGERGLLEARGRGLGAPQRRGHRRDGAAVPRRRGRRRGHRRRLRCSPASAARCS